MPHRAEFVVVGWTQPEGRRPYLGALLLGYYDSDGRLIYAGRVGSGMWPLPSIRLDSS
jgi:bifunctional non-homologous end joining protein LigD